MSSRPRFNDPIQDLLGPRSDIGKLFGLGSTPDKLPADAQKELDVLNREKGPLRTTGEWSSRVEESRLSAVEKAAKQTRIKNILEESARRRMIAPGAAATLLDRGGGSNTLLRIRDDNGSR